MGATLWIGCKSRKSGKVSGFFKKSVWTKRKALLKNQQCYINSCLNRWWRIPGSNRWPLACHASALPAELIPHNFPEMVASGKRMLKQEIFYLIVSWGCVTEYLGLPSELHPHGRRGRFNCGRSCGYENYYSKEKRRCQQKLLKKAKLIWICKKQAKNHRVCQYHRPMPNTTAIKTSHKTR